MTEKEPFLTLFCGPMFAGKTTKLHTQMTEYKYNRKGYKVLCINHINNIRYGSQNSITHRQISNGEHLEIHDCISTDKLMSLLPKYLNNNVFIIDEGQFYPDLIDFVNILLSYQKNIIIAGLDYDIERRRFGQILDLADIINKNIYINQGINTNIHILNNQDCMICNTNKATHTIRCDVEQTEQIVIGGFDEYKGTCSECWRLWKKKSNMKTKIT